MSSGEESTPQPDSIPISNTPTIARRLTATFPSGITINVGEQGTAAVNPTTSTNPTFTNHPTINEEIAAAALDSIPSIGGVVGRRVTIVGRRVTRRLQPQQSNERVAEIPDVMDKRNMILDNLIGNYMIAQAQVDKIRGMIVGLVTKNDNGGPALNTNHSPKSVHEFNYNGKWYRITNTVEEIPAPFNIVPNKSDEDLK